MWLHSVLSGIGGGAIDHGGCPAFVPLDKVTSAGAVDAGSGRHGQRGFRYFEPQFFLLKVAQ